MTPVEWKIPVADAQTTAIYDEAAPGNAVFICAHGAGGNIADRATLATARALGGQGIGVVRFNFLYREKKSGRPDPMPKLMETFTAVAERARSELNPDRLVIGGRSMGGRAASMLAAEGYDADGLLLLAYPLHPPGKPEQLRDAHLSRIRMPVLCFNGTRDPFCIRGLMDRVLASVTASWEMHWVEQADHSFHVPRSSGRTDAEVLALIADVSRNWIERMSA
ncbi:MAG TPA: alpha/beta family hydrolase [Gemmatimonadaceae bacterium]